MKHLRAICIALAISSVFTAWAHASDEVTPGGFHGQVLSIQMIDAQTGWATGRSSDSAALLQTHDGGKSWTDISARLLRSKEPVLASDASSAVSFRLLDAKHGWAAFAENIGDLEATLLYSTEDGGHSWQKNSFKTKIGGIGSIQFTDSTHGFILVESDAAMGKSMKATYHTADGGRTWQATSETSWDADTKGALPQRGLGASMVFRNASSGWVAGSPRGDQDAYFFRTKNGGKTWRPQRFDQPPGFTKGYAEFHTPWFFGDKKADGVLSASFTQHDPERGEVEFYASQDGGEHWQRMGTAPTENSKISSDNQVFLDAKHGWLATDDGQFFSTADGAATWRKIESKLRLGDKESISQVEFINPTQGWLVKSILGGDYDYELLQTTDAGQTWTHCFGPEDTSAQP